MRLDICSEPSPAPASLGFRSAGVFRVDSWSSPRPLTPLFIIVRLCPAPLHVQCVTVGAALWLNDAVHKPLCGRLGLIWTHGQTSTPAASSQYVQLQQVFLQLRRRF